MNIQTKQDLYNKLGLSPIICKLRVIHSTTYAIWNNCLLWNEEITENNLYKGYCIYKDIIYKIHYKEITDSYFEVMKVELINTCF